MRARKLRGDRTQQVIGRPALLSHDRWGEIAGKLLNDTRGLHAKCIESIR